MLNFENKHRVIQNLNHTFASCSLKMCGASHGEGDEMTKYIFLSQILIHSTAFKATLEVVLLAAGRQPLWWWTHFMAASLALELQDKTLFQENKRYRVSRKLVDKTVLFFFSLREQLKAHHFSAGVGDQYLMNHVGISSSLGKNCGGRIGNWEDLKSAW